MPKKYFVVGCKTAPVVCSFPLPMTLAEEVKGTTITSVTFRLSRRSFAILHTAYDIRGRTELRRGELLGKIRVL